MTYVSIPEMNMLKNSLKLSVYVTINLSIKLDFVSVNGRRKTYFVGALRTVVPQNLVKIVWAIF